MKINEIFGPTIQGEGKSVGREVAFIRTSLCNLNCVWCDTPYTWFWSDREFDFDGEKKKGTFERSDEIHEMSTDDIVEELSRINVDSIVISGGEPFIQHRQLTELCQSLKELGYWIEVETNGTIFPNEKLIGLVDQINCSPKLSNSKNKLKARENEEALRKLSALSIVNFKFVVSSPDDIEEILQMIEKYQMKEVYLMPLGKTKDELEQTTSLTKELCFKYGFNFSDRIHITQLGGGRRV